MPIVPRELIAGFLQREEIVSEWLEASVIDSLTTALGDADAIAVGSWWHDEEARQIKGLVAHRPGEWLLVMVRSDDRHGTEVGAHERTTSFGDISGVGLVTHRMFGALPGGPVSVEAHALHLRHPAFPGGRVSIELHDRLHSESRDEIVAAFRAACARD